MYAIQRDEAETVSDVDKCVVIKSRKLRCIRTRRRVRWTVRYLGRWLRNYLLYNSTM